MKNETENQAELKATIHTIMVTEARGLYLLATIVTVIFLIASVAVIGACGEVEGLFFAGLAWASFSIELFAWVTVRWYNVKSHETILRYLNQGKDEFYYEAEQLSDYSSTSTWVAMLTLGSGMAFTVIFANANF